MSTAIIYVRVSDQRQVDGTSLETQEIVCREWCAANGYVVERVFIEAGVSAKTAERPAFQQMFRYIENKPKGAIDAVVVYKFDRFSRNFEDGVLLQMRLRAHSVQRISATEKTDNSPEGLFMLRIMDAQSEMDNQRRSQRATSGMKHRVSSGRYVFATPTGYLPGSKSGPSLVIDPKRGPLIRKLFERVASGEAKYEALKHVTALGLRAKRGGKMGQETLRKILKNPVYKGEIFVEEWGIVARGDYESIVSIELFDKVQAILAGRAPAHGHHTKDRVEFPLRGVVICPDCLKPVTASKSTNKIGKKFGYYHCHRGAGHLRVSTDKLEADFVALLERLTPTSDRVDLIERIFRDVWNQKRGTAEAESDALRRELGRLEQRRKRVLEQMAEGHVAGSEYATIAKETAESSAEVRTRLAISESRELDLDTAVSYLHSVLWNTAAVWQTSDLQRKKQIQRRIFPEGIVYTEDGFGTPVTSSFYEMLQAENAEELEMVRPE